MAYSYFRCCGIQADLHQPGNFADDELHHAQVVEHIDYSAQKDNDRRHLEQTSSLHDDPLETRTYFEGEKMIFEIDAEDED